MPRPLRKAFAGAIYHITVRGNGRQKIFWGVSDYVRFVEQIQQAVELDNIVLYCYVLMQNHYHLLCETPHGNIQRFMHRLNTAYAMYFRYKHNKPGHCFQGRYKAKLVEGHDYLVRLTRYIHLNPVNVEEMNGRTAEEKWQYLLGRRWSSLKGYMLTRFEEKMVNYELLWLMGGRTSKENRAAYRRYMQSMLSSEDKLIREALAASNYAIGDEKFVAQVEADLKGVPVEDERAGDVIWPEEESVSLEDIERRVAKEFGVEVDDLHVHGNRCKEAKAATLEIACRLSRKTHREIGKFFGVSGSTVGKQRQRLRRKLERRIDLQKKVNRTVSTFAHDKKIG